MVCFVSRFAAVVLLAAACNFAFAAAQERHLSASGEGTNAYWNYAHYGWCEATHLGRTLLYVDNYFDDYMLRGGLLYSFGGVLTSANGDEIFFVFDAGDGYIFDPADGVVATTATITGGWGRFEGVTGSITVTFDFDPNFELFSFEIDGLIDY